MDLLGLIEGQDGGLDAAQHSVCYLVEVIRPLFELRQVLCGC